MIRQVPVSVTFALRCSTKRDSVANVFVSHCPAVDVYSQGRTKEEAKDALRSAVRLFIAASYEQGTLEQTLKSQGFIVATPKAATNRPLGKEFMAWEEGLVEEFDIDVPLSLISQESPACQT